MEAKQSMVLNLQHTSDLKTCHFRNIHVPASSVLTGVLMSFEIFTIAEVVRDALPKLSHSVFRWNLWVFWSEDRHVLCLSWTLHKLADSTNRAGDCGLVPASRKSGEAFRYLSCYIDNFLRYTQFENYTQFEKCLYMGLNFIIRSLLFTLSGRKSH